MEDTIVLIKDITEKNLIDYLAVFSPIVLSVIAVIISLWDSIWSSKAKRLEADLVWDEIYCSFIIIIQNAGNRGLIIDSVSLVAYKGKECYELGTRNNAWAFRQPKPYINKNEAISLFPIYDSVYDVFGYKGHDFEVDEVNKDFPVYLVVKDIKNGRSKQVLPWEKLTKNWNMLLPYGDFQFVNFLPQNKTKKSERRLIREHDVLCRAVLISHNKESQSQTSEEFGVLLQAGGKRAAQVLEASCTVPRSSRLNAASSRSAVHSL